MSVERGFTPEPIVKKDADLYIIGEIGGESPAKFLALLGERQANPNVKEISLFIDSCGGDVFASLEMAEMIARSPKKIKTIGMGRVYSGAALVFAAGHERIAWESSDYMIHSIQCSMNGGSPEMIKAELAEVERINEIWLKALAKYTGHSLSQIRYHTKDDFYMTPEMAVGYGLADKVEITQVFRKKK